MHRTVITAIVLSVFSLMSTPLPAGQTIWQIGEVDGDYNDLASPGDLNTFLQRFTAHPRFAVGKDDPKEKFSAIHPGPLDFWASGRTYEWEGGFAHTFTITFDLPDAPKGHYLLSIDLVDAHNSSPPIMEVSVNGHATRKRLTHGTGDPTLMNPSKGKAQRLRVILTADELKPQSNTLEIVGREGSWMIYDALSLQHLDKDEIPEAQILAEPKIFFIEREGKLLQEFSFLADGIVEGANAKIVVTAGTETLATLDKPRVQLGVCDAPIHLPPTKEQREITIELIARKQQASATMTQYPEKLWRIYVAPSTHTDIGYTDVQSKVIALHNRNTDLALELIDEFPLYHWNLESSWAAQMWLRDNPHYAHKRLYSAAEQRRLGIESSYLNMLTGLCSGEEIIRNLYYSARLLREHDVPFKSHTLTDAPSHVWTVPTVLKNCGIDYLSVGVNQTRAPLFRHDLHRKSPFWWEGPDGSRILTWMTTGYAQAGWIGLKEGPKQMRESIERTLWRWRLMEEYPYDAVLLHGAYLDNVAIGRDIAESVTAYAERYAYPKVILAANDDFFRYIEERFIDHVPTVRGGGGSWWEDGAASSARETALNRNTHEDIIAAETVWAVMGGHLAKERFPQNQFNTVWDNILLYDEHTWGAHNSISEPESDFVQRQFAVKAAYAEQAADMTQRLMDRGLRLLGTRVNAPAGSVLVFNPSGRARGGVVYASIPKGKMLVDAQGRPRPQQLNHAEALGTMQVAVRVEDVPPVGYATYRLMDDGGQLSAPAPRFDAEKNVLENEHYRITFDVENASIASLIDKHAGKELVDAASPHKFGQVIYASGGEEVEGQTQVNCPDPAKVTFSKPTNGGIKVARAGAVFTSVSLACVHPMFRSLTLEVIAYEHEPRLDFVYHLDKKMTYVKEALYFAFPVAGADPKFQYEIGAGSVRPNDDHFPGACRDWFSVQRWVTVNTDDVGVAWSPIDTPLISLCDMNPGKWLDTLEITNGTIFAYAMNNYWFTNYKAGQDRDHVFRYALTSGASMDEQAAVAFGEEACVPFQVIKTRPQRREKETGWPARQSFVQIEPSNVMVSTIKRADDGDGIIVRLRETKGQDARATLQLNLPAAPQAAYACDLVERVQGELSLEENRLSLEVPARSMVTVRLK